MRTLQPERRENHWEDEKDLLKVRHGSGSMGRGLLRAQSAESRGRVEGREGVRRTFIVKIKLK